MQQLPLKKYNLYGYQKIYLKWWKNNVISWNWGSILLQTYENQFVSKGVVHNLIFFLSKNIKHQSINVDNKTNKQIKQNSLARLTMVWWCPWPSEHHELLCIHQQTLHLKLCHLFQPNDSRPLHQLKDKFTQKSYITGLRTHFHQPLKHQSFVQLRKFKYQIQHYTITLTLDRHRDEFQWLNLWNTMPRATHWLL